MREILRLIETDVFLVPSTDILFNQYNDNDQNDITNGSEIRKDNLRRYIQSFRTPPSIVLVGEAPGFHGCRFSGVPFTDERNLLDGIPIIGEKSSVGPERKKERSAGTVWSVLAQYRTQLFIWNCIPFHPHTPGDNSQNRTPTNIEFSNHKNILRGILRSLGPQHVFAVGKRAETTLSNINIKSDYIRHPAHGGDKIFKNTMSRRLNEITQVHS